MPETKQIVTMHLDDFYLGIPVENVQEIIRNQKLTRVPLSDSSVCGLINLRGQIVPVVDLRRRLELGTHTKSASGTSAMNVVVRTAGGAMSFQVDRIGEVLEVDESSFEAPPNNVKQSVRSLLTGIYKLKERFLHVLSVEDIVAFRSRVSMPSGDGWTEKIGTNVTVTRD